MIKAYTQCSLEAQFTADQQIVVSFCCCALSPPSSPSISHLLDLSHVGGTSRSRWQFNLGGGDVAAVDLDLHTRYEVDPFFDGSSQHAMRKYKKGLVTHQLARNQTNVKRVSEDQRLWLGQGFPQRVPVLHRSRHFLVAESSLYGRYVLCAIFYRSANLPTKHVFSVIHVSAVVTFHGL